MSERPHRPRWLEWLVAVQGVTDPAEARLAGIFNVALLSTLLLVGGSFAVLVAMSGPVTLSPSLILVVFLMGVALAALVGLLWFNKRGYYRRIAGWYIGVFYTLILISNIMYDGFQASTWVFLVWILTLAAFFLPTRTVGWMLFGGLALWVLLFMGETAGFYHPWLTSKPEESSITIRAFTLLVTAATVPMVMIGVQHLREIMARWQTTVRELEVYRRTLEQQVAARTEEARQHASDFQAVAELGQIIISSRELKPMLQQAVQFIADRLGFYQVGVFLLDETRQWVVLEAASSQGGQEMLAHHLQLRVGQQGIIGHVAESRRAYITADVTSDPYYLTLVELPHTRSEAALPLIYQGELVGVLDVQSRKPAAFTEAAIRVLQVLADNLAVAIQNVSHAEEIERTLDRLTRYQEEEVVRLWQKTLRRHVGRLGYFYDRAQVSLLPADTPLLAAVPAGVDRPVTLTMPEGAQRLVVPLRVRERTVGRFVFEAERPWTPEELGVVEAVVAQLGLALENAQLLEESRQRAVFERTASEVTANIRREVEIEAVLERALAELGKALGAERAIARLSITE